MGCQIKTTGTQRLANGFKPVAQTSYGAFLVAFLTFLRRLPQPMSGKLGFQHADGFVPSLQFLFLILIQLITNVAKVLQLAQFFSFKAQLACYESPVCDYRNAYSEQCR